MNAPRIGITGTYSSGKTLTAFALSNFTGIPRTQAMTMREILPFAAPGKTLEECTAAELLQMIVERHCDRVVHEYRLRSGFISDGCSLQEWIYGSIRVYVGINPNQSAALGPGKSVPATPELEFFDDVMNQVGKVLLRHVKKSFDVFVHLRNELPLAEDGHRPVNDNFRRMSDEKLLRTLDELSIPYHVVSGSIEERLEAIATVFDLPRVMTVEEAVVRAKQQYASLDTRDETSRAVSVDAA
ncbi:AAA family ATPase [Millisia brevis]|uniref:AAA family ATPase n=1 Tax=Millisia brevis TaxID=264148 RepID=UPI0008319683|nr:AAA family ATPase [Millisia brevis]